MSAKITILWAVSTGFQPGDYARLCSNGGSGDIDYDNPIQNNKIDLFPQNGGLFGWYHLPWYHFPWYHGQASRCPGWYHLPWYHFPWYHGTTVLKNEITVDFCGDYKFAYKIFDKLGNANVGTPDEVTATVHIAPPQPTGLKKGTYGNVLSVTGDCTPDVTGTYYFDGLWGTLSSYRRSDGAYYLFYDDGLPGYVFSASKGGAGYYYDSDYNTDPQGTYTPYDLPAEGSPEVVSLGIMLTLEAA